MAEIPLCRPSIDQKEIDAVQEAVKSGWLTHGPMTTAFEGMVADFLDVKYAIAMNSCTSALFLALIANGIQGEVLLPGFTFIASANAVKTAGAEPVFIDIQYSDCNMDPECLEEALTLRTEAVMPVHYGGQACDMDSIRAFADKHQLLLLEDSAETLGGTYKGKQCGSFGIGCFSFFPTKNITTGEGGMLTTDDTALATKIRTLINHGIDKSTLQRSNEQKNWDRRAVLPGYNFRLSNILAAIGVEQMKKIETMNRQRRELSLYLIEGLRDIEEIDLPVENEHCRHVYQMFTIKLRKGDRDDLVHYLRNNGIGASVHFDPPAHRHPAYEKSEPRRLPVTEHVAKHIVTLPMFPELQKSELQYMIQVIKQYHAERRNSESHRLHSGL